MIDAGHGAKMIDVIGNLRERRVGIDAPSPGIERRLGRLGLPDYRRRKAGC